MGRGAMVKTSNAEYPGGLARVRRFTRCSETNELEELESPEPFGPIWQVMSSLAISDFEH